MKTVFHITSPPLCKLLLASTLVLASCQERAEPTAVANQSPVAKGSASPQNIRQPAVAGLFYPKDPKTLANTVDQCLAAAPTNAVASVRALICPHAGYEYSGPVAAYAYKRIASGSFDTVIILAPSHYALFQGVSVPATDAYETPLGQVPISEKARQLAKQSLFVLEPRCLVQRPQWSTLASKPSPSVGEDTPETWEHSVEVQVPFLQPTLKQFKILPLIFGLADPAEVAKALAPMLDDRTLVIASSDLSHYHPYEEARALDHQTVKWICNLDIAALQAPDAEGSACGRMPILALLHLAKLKGWTPQLLDYRNSGDTAGDKSRVVGYCAVAFTSGDRKATLDKASTVAKSAAQFNPAERKFLLELARQALTRVTAGRDLPEMKSDAVPEPCRAAKGCFVTLTKSGELRGCVGNILPAGPLYQAVMHDARSAALRDPRFPPVTADEAATLHIEISVLTVPEPLAFASPDELLAKLQPHRDGVVLKIGERGATFLPQVWEPLPDKAQFLSHLAAKAGCAPSAWRGKDVSVSIYHVEAFEEPK
jgi:AmmeMemoRadiSam system protein B/AmmeMemoRadiSam system protein A